MQTVLKIIKNKSKTRVLVILSLIFLGSTFSRNILNGYSAFWFDPARDFILALANLNKISLIGSPTGIPGVFYGPYWIWLISFAMLATKDPSLIIIILLVMPYFIIFPALLLKFQKFFPKGIIIALLWLFYLSSGNYIIQIWNINYAPLIFLAITNLVVVFSKLDRLKYKLFCIFATAALNALLINFNFSFGFAVTISTAIFIAILQLQKVLFNKANLNTKILTVVSVFFTYFLGLLLIETPIIIFEIRHNFLQTKAIIRTLTEAILYNSAVVGQTGQKKYEILNSIIFTKPARFLAVNTLVLKVIYIFLVFLIIYTFAKRKEITIQIPKILTIYLLLTTLVTALIYTSSKNPIFDYHFAGLEIVILFLTGIVVKNNSYLRKLLYIWVLLLAMQNIFSFIKYYNFVQYKGTPLWLKTAIVKTVYEDAGRNQFQAFAYSPAIYTYDYDYLFYWLGTYYKTQPIQNTRVNTIYLIIPDSSKDIYYDFINYKTPNTQYKSKKIWVMIDGTTILKRVKTE